MSIEDLLDQKENTFKIAAHPADSFELDEEIDEVFVLSVEDPDSGDKHFAGMSHNEDFARLLSVSPYMLALVLLLAEELNEKHDRMEAMEVSEMKKYGEATAEIMALIGEETINNLMQGDSITD